MAANPVHGNYIFPGHNNGLPAPYFAAHAAHDHEVEVLLVAELPENHPTATTDAQKKSILRELYTSTQSPSDRCNRKKVVLGCVLTGAAVGGVAGALAGAPALGIGAVPGGLAGAGIGGLAGLGIGLAITAGMEPVQYKKWEKKYKELSVALELSAKLNNKLDELLEATPTLTRNPAINYRCPITGCIPLDPVRGPHGDHVFERWAIEKEIGINGKDPTNRSPLSKKQLQTSTLRMGLSKKLCADLIEGRRSAENFSEIEMEGIVAMHADLEDRTTAFYLAESQNLLDQLAHKQISRARHGQLTQFLLSDLDPE